MFDDSDVIYGYSRAQAISDGVLVDVSSTAREAGFVIPVAVTRRVWDEIITPHETARSLGQSELGRLWDVLSVLLISIRQNRSADPSCQSFQIAVYHGDDHVADAKLKAVCGPGDAREPVITIMCPDED